MDKYRIPKIEEFVQGFEFEVAHDYNWCILNLSNIKEPKVKGPMNRCWIPCKVWWMEPEDKLITEKMKDGSTLTVKRSFYNFFKPFNEKAYLEQGLIRVKIK